MSDYFKSYTLTNRQAGVRHEDGTTENFVQQIHIPSQFEYDVMDALPYIAMAVGVGIMIGYIAWLNMHVGL